MLAIVGVYEERFHVYAVHVRALISTHSGRRPRYLEAEDVHAYLGISPMEKGVAAATRNQATNAVVFLYLFETNRDENTYEEEFPGADLQTLFQRPNWGNGSKIQLPLFIHYLLRVRSR